MTAITFLLLVWLLLVKELAYVANHLYRVRGYMIVDLAVKDLIISLRSQILAQILVLWFVRSLLLYYLWIKQRLRETFARAFLNWSLRESVSFALEVSLGVSYERGLIRPRFFTILFRQCAIQAIGKQLRCE